MRLALAAPMPLAPPVMRATRPSKSVSVIAGVYSSRVLAVAAVAAHPRER
jgi:hypothetical protein